MMHPCCFFLDSNLNILITDYSRHYVSIFSSPGELIYKFGKEGEETGLLFNFVVLLWTQKGGSYSILQSQSLHSTLLNWDSTFRFAVLVNSVGI